MLDSNILDQQMHTAALGFQYYHHKNP